MIKIRVKLFGQLSSRIKDGNSEVELDLAENTRIKDILRYFKIRESSGMLVLVNNRISVKETILHTGDKIKIYPLAIGG
jgi:molybdopterin converting factor small subunit